MTRINVALKSTISLNCRLCRSNPASAIHWLFNGKALDFQGKRMHLFNHTSSCLQTLSLLTVRSEDEGNYTCVARNKFGEANSTTEITIIGKYILAAKNTQFPAPILSLQDPRTLIFVQATRLKKYSFD